MTALLAKITFEHLYSLIGMILIIFSISTLRDEKNPHRFGTAAFWLLFGLTFLIGIFINPANKEVSRPYYIAAGLMVVAMTGIASLGWFSLGSYNEATAEVRKTNRDKLGNKIFLPLVLIPIILVILATFFKVNALIGFGIASVIGFLIIFTMTRPGLVQASNEGRRVLDAIGWAVILSQFLAALGFLFDQAGVGAVIAGIVKGIIPANSYLAAVLAYALGMMLFTMIMGNAFAAFAVITTGIGIPLVINQFGANPAIVGSIAMLSGFCGTLLTPMAANFNIVPAALLEMKDKNGVIKAQVPLALAMIGINICFMYFFGMMK